jgi:hypothetical protein
VRSRQQILDSLERVYRQAFTEAGDREDTELLASLDFQFQRDQVGLEVLLDIRDLLFSRQDDGRDAPRTGDEVSGLLDTAQKIKNLTRLR